MLSIHSANGANVPTRRSGMLYPGPKGAETIETSRDFSMRVLISVPLLLLLAIVSRADEPTKRTPKVPLGKDTTVVDGPLDEDGYVDYFAVLSERLGKEITPENNANVPLWRPLGPKPDGHA